MTQLVKFPIEQAFKTRLQRHGFDLDDPERRHPSRNDFPQKILDLRGRIHGGKAKLLLRDRTGFQKDARTRLLPWLIAGLGGTSWPEHVAAHDHHVPDLYEPTALMDGPLVSPSWADVLTNVDLSNPLFVLSIGATLLLTQTIAVFQRRALLRTSVSMAAQPDLFPETPAVEIPAHSERHAQNTPLWHWTIDAETRQGQVRSENQDALVTFRFSDQSAAMIVCDGAGGVGGGRQASQSAVRAIEGSLRASHEQEGAIHCQHLETAISAARQANASERLEGVTTALVLALEGEMLHFATLGDGAVTIIWPDGMIGQVQIPHHTIGQPSNVIDAYIGGGCEVAPRTGSLRLEPGCIVMAMSDGVSDLITFEDFACRREALTHIDGLADTVLTQLEEARDPDTGGWLHSDNMTLAIARLTSGETSEPVPFPPLKSPTFKSSRT